MRKGTIFASGIGLAILAFVTLAPVYNPPSGGGGLTSPVGISDGGSGATTAAGARTNYGLAIGTDVTRGGYTTTATAAGTTVFTVSSTRVQFFTGSTTQTITLPVTSTLYLGFPFLIENNSSGIVTVNSSGGNAVIAIPANTSYFVTCILITGTSAVSWDTEQISGYGPAPSDTAYNATSWDGVTTIAPSKNAIRDKILVMDSATATAQSVADNALTAVNNIGPVTAKVIGTALFDGHGGSVSGLFTTGIISTVTYNSTGKFDVVFTASEANVQYLAKAEVFDNGNLGGATMPPQAGIPADSIAIDGFEVQVVAGGTLLALPMLNDSSARRVQVTVIR